MASRRSVIAEFAGLPFLRVHITLEHRVDQLAPEHRLPQLRPLDRVGGLSPVDRVDRLVRQRLLHRLVCEYRQHPVGGIGGLGDVVALPGYPTRLINDRRETP